MAILNFVNSVNDTVNPTVPGSASPSTAGYGTFTDNRTPGMDATPIFTEPSSGGSSHADPSFIGDSFTVNPQETAQSIYDKVVNSSAYQEAFTLFSSSSDFSYFLQRLKAIPESILSPESTWFDEIGLSNRYEDKFQAAYQYCMEQITALLAEFHAWYNSLPSTQVQQYQDAGINAAVTGVGISGSSLSGSNGVSSNPSALSSTNPLEVINSLADIALNVLPNSVSTITGMWKSIQDVRLANRGLSFNESSWLANTRQSLINQGFTLSDDSWNTIDDFNNWIDNLGNDSKASSLLANQQIVDFLNSLKYDSLIYSTSDLGWTDRTFGLTYQEFLNDLGNYQIKEFADTLIYNSELATYNKEYQSLLSASDAAGAVNARNQMEKFQNNFLKTTAENRLKFYNSWLERVQKSNDPVAKFSLYQTMFNDNLITYANVGFDTLKDFVKFANKYSKNNTSSSSVTRSYARVGGIRFPKSK